MRATAETRDARLRRAVWAIAAAVYLGAAVELVLVAHYEEWRQWIALVAVAAGLAAVVWAWRAPSAPALRTARAVSGVVVVVSVLGVGFHLWGNASFSREVAPGGDAWERVWDTLTGGNPAFAPGMLAVAGALGLAAAWAHPAREIDPAGEPGADAV